VNDLSRYARQIVLPEVGVAGQQMLRDSSALILGVGALGSAASLYLAAAGLGRLWLVDRDRVELSNLQRQVLYRQADVGRAKLEAAAATLSALNPDCAIETLTGPLTQDALLQAVRRVDIALDCSDNFAARTALNAACVSARKPLVSGAAIRFEGQLALFDPARGGACYACLYPDPGDDAERCEDAGILGPVAGGIGAMQALLALKRLLGLGDDAGRLWLWDALRMSWRSVAIPRDPACAVCGGVR